VTGRDFSQELTTLSQSIERLRKDIENLRGKMWRAFFEHLFYEVHQIRSCSIFSRFTEAQVFLLNPDPDQGFAEHGSKTVFLFYYQNWSKI
jgi:hypothetical protein